MDRSIALDCINLDLLMVNYPNIAPIKMLLRLLKAFYLIEKSQDS